VEECARWYRELHARNVAVDFVAAGSDLSRYRLVIVPALYLLGDATADTLTAFTRAGGHLVVTFFSGVVNESEQVGLGGYPAQLRELLGLWVEEWHALKPDQTQNIRWRTDADTHAGGGARSHRVEHWSELVHLTGASCIAEFDSGPLSGKPALTSHGQGAGRAYYVATRLGTDAREHFVERLLKESNVQGVLATPLGVEACVRQCGEQRTLFLINHCDEEREVRLDEGGTDLSSGEPCNGLLRLPPQAVRVIELNRSAGAG
jgi:beta-galactosidase